MPKECRIPPKSTFSGYKRTVGLAILFCFMSTSVMAVTVDSVPQTVPIPASKNSAVSTSAKEKYPFLLPEGARTIRGPEKPFPIETRAYMPILPDFYMSSGEKLSPGVLQTFIEGTLVPKESTYFRTDVGVDLKSGMPYDHVRIRLKESLLSEIGNYTAASKLSLFIPYLVKVIRKDPVFHHAAMSPQDALTLLTQTLMSLRDFIKAYPDYGGFIPWVDIRPNGTIAPANAKIPSLDNGQLTWALAGVVAAFEDSPQPRLKELASLAAAILQSQDYAKFYDPEKKLLHGTIQQDPLTKEWNGDKTYYLNDMFEGTLAVLWGVLNGQIPQDAWDNLAIPTTEYYTMDNEKVTVLAGFRASFHEQWALAFIPFMESALAPLFQNFLFVQADYAHRHQMPGFLSTAYDSKGIYQQMGIPEIAYNPVDRDDVAVFFATAMGMLISPTVGASWLSQFYRFHNFVSPYGALESIGRDGYADIFTADAKGMTLLAVSGGFVPEVKKYLSERKFPGTEISMEVKMIELLHAKYKQMLQERNHRPLHFPTQNFSTPPESTFPVRLERLPDPGPFFDISAHLQSGHLHGKNVRSVGQKTLEQDIFPGAPLQFEYDIPPYFAYYDQWAFRGTYIDHAVKIADMEYLSVTIPTNSDTTLFEVELKSDDITLAAAVIDTSLPGILSADGATKTLVHKIKAIPEADYKPFNYVGVAIHDPRFLLAGFKVYLNQGTVKILKLMLTKKNPSNIPEVEEESRIAPGEFELIRYWRPAHGGLVFYKDDPKSILRFSAGAGWRGGYIPYTNLSKYKYLYLRARSLDAGCNCFYMELKHEGTLLMRYKLPIHMARDEEWHIYEIAIPEEIQQTFNYFAISDPFKQFELGSILLSRTPISDVKIEKVPPPKLGQKPLECEYRACVEAPRD